MPSERFHKLKQVKKRTFLRMAYKEFALHSYEGASISRLVSDLKMAKGSIYHYFDDKEDMCNYLIEHAFDQLQLVLSKSCSLPESSLEFDSWYRKFLLVYVKFLCALPSYAFLMRRHKIDHPNHSNDNEELIIDMINQSAHGSVSNERLFFLRYLPLLIFDYLLKSEQIDMKEIIKSGNVINVSSDKLLYLCEAFLTRE
jgi:AcrR family transcriptional regulator